MQTQLVAKIKQVENVNWKHLRRQYLDLADIILFEHGKWKIKYGISDEEQFRLTKALLNKFCSVLNWSINKNSLVPPFMNRIRYIIIANNFYSQLYNTIAPYSWIDLGTGSSAIYALIIAGCNFGTVTAIDCNYQAIENCFKLMNSNPHLSSFIKLKLNLSEVILDSNLFDTVHNILVCNPPYFDESKTNMKNKTYLLEKANANEIFCEAGFIGFIKKIALESRQLFSLNQDAAKLYTVIVPQKSALIYLQAFLRVIAKVKSTKVLGMIGGRTKSWVLAWSFVKDFD